MPKKWHRIGRGIHIGQPYKSRDDDTWCVIIKRKDYEGGMRRIIRVGPSRASARDCAVNTLEDLNATGSDKLTVASVLLRFMSDHARTLRRHTEDLYRGHVRNHLVPRLGHIKAHAVTETEVFDYAEARLTEASGSTVMNEVTALQTAFNWYWERFDLDSKNPARFMRKAFRKAADRVNVEPKPKREDYTAEEVEILLRIAAEHPNADAVDLFLFGGAMGIRKGEILGMEWTGIDWKAGTYKPVTSIDNAGKEGPPKGKRKLPADLPPIILERLAARWEERRSDRWVFSTKNGTPYSGRNVQRWFQRIRNQAAEEGVPLSKKFHSLRHFFVSQAAENGWSWTAIQNQVGHATADFTMRRYTHPVRGDRDWSWSPGHSGHKVVTAVTESKTIH